MFEAQKRETIATRLKSNLKETLGSEISTIEGTFESDNIQANSYEFEKSYAEMEMIVEAAFADTSWDNFLTMRAAEMGVIRKEAVKAIGKVKVTGTAGAKIIKGSLFATPDGTNFYTTADAVIGADKTAEIAIEAQVAGNDGNVKENTIVKIPMSIPGVHEVTNEAVTYDGFDKETDEDLKTRYFLKVRTPATSGNKNHYKQWAMAVAGVGNAKVFPTWNGQNTVKVVIVEANNGTANEELIERCFGYIEEQRPIGAIVTVTTAQPKTVNISAKIDGILDLEELRKKVNLYFKTFGFDSGHVSIAKIGAYLISCTNVNDYDNLKLNGTEENVNLEVEELPVIGEIVNDP